MRDFRVADGRQTVELRSLARAATRSTPTDRPLATSQSVAQIQQRRVRFQCPFLLAPILRSQSLVTVNCSRSARLRLAFFAIVSPRQWNLDDESRLPRPARCGSWDAYTLTTTTLTDLKTGGALFPRPPTRKDSVVFTRQFCLISVAALSLGLQSSSASAELP